MMSRITFLKKLDALLGSILVVLLPGPPRKQLDSTVNSVLVIRPGGIGDALLLAPTLHVLASHYPSARITVLSEKRNAGAFRLIAGVDEILLYDCPAELGKVLLRGYDLVIDTEQWHRLSAVVARLASRGFSIGFGTNNRSRLFSHVVPYRQDDYEAQSFLNLLRPLGIALIHDPGVPFLSVPQSAEIEAAELLSGVTGRYVAIFAGASIRERKWGDEKFRELVRMLADTGIRSVIVGGRADSTSALAIAGNSTAVNLAGKTSISVTAAIIKSASLLVSGDSGILHIGVGLGVPTVSMFGPGIAAKWAPRGRGDVVLDKKLPCSPCTLFGTTPICRSGALCLVEISVAEVYSAVIDSLNNSTDLPGANS